jgi:hypothetical protein
MFKDTAASVKLRQAKPERQYRAKVYEAQALRGIAG